MIRNALSFPLGVLILLLLPVAVHAQDAPFVRDAFNRINAQRKQHGLDTLTYNKTLEEAAQAHAEWMARSRKMEHLQAPPGSFEEHATCNHHPINRAINGGYIGWDGVFRVERTATGAVVHAKPGADNYVGEIIAAGWGAGHPAIHTGQIVTGWMNSPGHRKEIQGPLPRDGHRRGMHPGRQGHLLVRGVRKAPAMSINPPS